MLYGKQFSTHEIGMQVSCHLYAKVSEKNHVQGAETGSPANYQKSVQVEKIEIIERHMIPDHVYLLVSVPPTQVMGCLKGKVQ